LNPILRPMEPIVRDAQRGWGLRFSLPLFIAPVVCVKFSKLVMVRVRRFIQVN